MESAVTRPRLLQTLLDGFAELGEECIQGANREVGALLGGELRTC